MSEHTVDLTLADRTDQADLEATVARLQQQLLDARAEISRLELQLHVLTTTDPLTGLANRNGILDSIQTAVARRRRMNEPFAVVCLAFEELAGLASRTDTDDHDGAIQHLAALVAAGLRNVDRVGRLNETTFAAVLTNIEATNIPVVVDRTLASIRALPLSVGEIRFDLDPSVAVAVPGEETPDAESYADHLIDVLSSSRAFSIDVLSD